MTRDALRHAADYLLARQGRDGLWRDYALPPGASSSWVTAVTGFALGRSLASPRVLDALSRAVAALLATRRQSGWGYNERVAPDADSTAWSLRLFSMARREPPVVAAACLGAFLGPNGGARTFAAGARYGTWVGEHADVTAVVGLALVEAGAQATLISSLRASALRQRAPNGLWTSFWWTFDAYAIARNLEFLEASGGIPRDVRAATRAYLASRFGPDNVLEAASLLIAATLTGGACDELRSWIVRRQLPSGGFQPSHALKLPAQHPSEEDGLVFEDGAGLLTTAMALLALGGSEPG